MGSDATDSRIDEDIEFADDEVDGSCSTRNKQGKVPKLTSKSKREKLKREHLNELFSKMADVLELNEQNNGKACILREAIKLVNDMLPDIQRLRKDNEALLSESQYLITEKDELEEEKSALEAQIKDIQRQIDEKFSQSKSDLSLIPPGCWVPGTSDFSEVPPSFHAVNPAFQQQSFHGPLYIVPAGPDMRSYSKSDTAANPSSNVSKPHPRYPTSTDTWTLQLLQK